MAYPTDFAQIREKRLLARFDTGFAGQRTALSVFFPGDKATAVAQNMLAYSPECRWAYSSAV
jgi:hypothetical protein